jgi:Ca2+/Na+ antiporter
VPNALGSAKATSPHNWYVSRIIGTVLGAIFAIWLVVTAAGGIIATVKTFVIGGHDCATHAPMAGLT